MRLSALIAFTIPIILTIYCIQQSLFFNTVHFSSEGAFSSLALTSSVMNGLLEFIFTGFLALNLGAMFFLAFFIAKKQ